MFHARVATNVLATVQRELKRGPQMAAEQVGRLGGPGVGNESDLANLIFTGRSRTGVDEVTTVVAETVVDKLRIANRGDFPS